MTFRAKIYGMQRCEFHDMPTMEYLGEFDVSTDRRWSSEMVADIEREKAKSQGRYYGCMWIVLNTGQNYFLL